MSCNIAPDRVYGQYKGDIRPKLKQWYDITRILGCELSSVSEEIRYSYDIDNATTFELDILGRIVGINRSFESVIELNPSAFGKSISEFGDLTTQFGAGNLVNSDEIGNEIYRILIKAKIAKNTSESTLDGVISALNYIVPSPDTVIIDNEDMTFSVSFNTTLSEIQRFVLNTFDILPRPQGVMFLGYTEEPSITEFGGSFDWGDSRAQFSLSFGV